MWVKAALLVTMVFLIASAWDAFGQTFRDDFNGSALDPDVWQIQAGDGAVTVADGHVRVSCEGSVFPFVITRFDPFPSGDFVVRVGMRYLAVRTCGNGFGAIDNFFPLSPQGCRPFLMWQDGAGWYVYSGSTEYAYLGPGPDLGYHIYEWRYSLGRYEFLIDGNPRHAGTCAPRATAVFFGHPHPVSCSPWTSFAIDFIEVSPLAAVPAPGTTWGRLKQLHR